MTILLASLQIVARQKLVVLCLDFSSVSAVPWFARLLLLVTLASCFSPICRWKSTWLEPSVAASASFVFWKAASNLCLLRQRERQSQPSSRRKLIAATVCLSARLSVSWIAYSLFLMPLLGCCEKIWPHYTAPPWCSTLAPSSSSRRV